MRFFSTLALTLATMLAALPARADDVQNERVILRPIGHDGAWLGFDLEERASGKLIAPVRLSSNNLIFADRLTIERKVEDGVAVQTVRFVELRSRLGAGFTLGEHDWLNVTLRANDPFPRVDFDITVANFTVIEWERFIGNPCPLHFLTVGMPDAAVWHQRGWLMATPKSDPFVLQQDVAYGGSVASEFSRNWSYICAIGGSPMPVIGLWAPAAKTYVGLEFQGARAHDNTARGLSAAYCSKQGADEQFVTLAFPHSDKSYRKLAYPARHDHVASHCRIVWSFDLPDTADPNRWLHQLFTERYAADSPRVPHTPNVGFMPGATRLADWPEPPKPHLIARHKTDTAFEVAGTVEVDGWHWHAESPVEVAYGRGDTKLIAQLKEDFAYLMQHAKTFDAGGEQCVFWEKPIEGCWTDKWGGEPVRTLHNANGFAAGIAMVDVWRHEKDAKLLPFIDGVYNWAKHFVWTRNEFADVPASPFAIGATLPATFLLDYYFTFKNSPDRGERAKAALDLAVSIAYRYLAAWSSDNDWFDEDDPSFLMEPNSGANWAGAPCANEVAWFVDTLAQVYVHTGDARLGYMLRGALDRWHLLYRDMEKPSLADYGHDAFTEGWGVYSGSGPGDGQRYNYGWADHLLYAWPFGDAAARVVCGERATLACVKTNERFDVDDYRTSGDGNFSFRIVSDRKTPFDIALSYPQVNLAGCKVSLQRDGQRRDWTDLRRPPQAPASLYLRQLRNGDIVIVGEPKLDAPPVQIARLFEHEKTEPQHLKAGGGDTGEFEMLPLDYDTALPVDWGDAKSWAGWPSGVRRAWGVPLWLAEPRATGGKIARAAPVKFAEPIEGPATLFLAFATTKKDAWFSAQFENGTMSIASGDPVVAWRSWPPLFKQRLMMVAVPVSPLQTLESLVPSRRGEALLFAATVYHGDSRHLAVTLDAVNDGAEAWRDEVKAEAEVASLRKQLDAVPDGRIAVLPTQPEGAGERFARKIGLLAKADALTPAQMVEPGRLDAKRYRVLLHLGNEHYPFTVRHEGDGRAALVNYLRSGGLIVCAGAQPFPFFYGEDLTKPGHAPANPLLPALGMPLKVVFEKLPAGHTLRFYYSSAQRVLPNLPWQIEFPATGDLRLRAMDDDDVDRRVLRYQPIYTVVDEHGKELGDAAVFAEFIGGEAKGGRVLYVWDRLLTEPESSRHMLSSTFHFVIEQAKKGK